MSCHNNCVRASVVAIRSTKGVVKTMFVQFTRDVNLYNINIRTNYRVHDPYIHICMLA